MRFVHLITAIAMRASTLAPQVLLLSCVLCSASLSQPAAAQSVAPLLERIQHGEPREQEAAFAQLLMIGRGEVRRGPPQRADTTIQRLLRARPDEAELICSTLIASLEAENALPAREYHGDLISAVAALRDPRAAKALAGALHTGSLAREGVITIGSAAVSHVIAAAQDSQMSQRSAGATTLGHLVRRRGESGISDAQVEAIRSALLSMLRDPHHYVRGSAINALDPFAADRLVQAEIARIADSDPYFSTKPNGEVWYDAREVAKSWLGKHARP